MISIRVYDGSRMLCKCHGLMMPDVEQTGFIKPWARQSCIDVCLAFALWTAAVACHWFASSPFSDVGEVVYSCAFTVCSDTLMALCLCAFQVCNCLTALVS